MLWEEVRNSIKGNPIRLSSYSSYAIKKDMKHFLFMFARYKFAMKMIANREELKVLELGCNDGLGTMMFEQSGKCKQVIGVDFDHNSIDWAQQNLNSDITHFIEEDFLGKEYLKADLVVSLDVIEHISKQYEIDFLETISKNLHHNGIAIIGTPNINMYQYTSNINKKSHINNYSQERLYSSLNKKFHNVFIFGMNDEILTTGFYPMTSYIIGLCCGKK